MKRILLTLTMLGLVASAARPAQARTEVSLDFFYNNLESQGEWIDVGGQGYCFRPSVEVNNSSWRPYSDGYWAHTEAGWTWVSYEDFGWATYHYGRWTRLHDYGWVWKPGTTWGPAWVSWRTGGDYVGWAPLPPESEEVVYEGRAITGHVDVEFDIGPSYYNFCDVRYIGEPVLRDRLFDPERNVTIIDNTVNVTNITYNNSNVYNGGPDYNRLNSYSTRPIQQLSLQRSANADMNVAAVQPGNFNHVQGNKLMVLAPMIQRSAQAAPPKAIKAKVEQPQFDHGWNGVQADEMKAKYKKESAKQIPPPTIAAHAPNAAQRAAAQPVGAPPVQPAMTPVTAGKKGKHGETAPIAAVPAIPAQPGAAPAVPAQPPVGKKGKHGEKAAPVPPSGAVPGTPAEPGVAPATPAQPAAGKHGKHDKVTAPAAPVSPEVQATPVPVKKGKHAEAAAAVPSEPAAHPAAVEPPRKKSKHSESIPPPEAQAAPVPRPPAPAAEAARPVKHRAEQIPDAPRPEQAPPKRHVEERPPVAPAPERVRPAPAPERVRPAPAPEHVRPAPAPQAPAPAQPNSGEKKKHKGEPEPGVPAPGPQ